MVVDYYNPTGLKRFRKNDPVQVAVPRAIHVLKR